MTITLPKNCRESCIRISIEEKKRKDTSEDSGKKNKKKKETDEEEELDFSDLEILDLNDL